MTCFCYFISSLLYAALCNVSHICGGGQHNGGRKPHQNPQVAVLPYDSPHLFTYFIVWLVFDAAPIRGFQLHDSRQHLLFNNCVNICPFTMTIGNKRNNKDQKSEQRKCEYWKRCIHWKKVTWIGRPYLNQSSLTHGALEPWWMLLQTW